jgi:WD40 repeat protein
MAFSPDGRELTLAYSDSTADVWDLPGEKLLRTVGQEFRLNVGNTFRLSRNGRRLVRVYRGGVKVWDVQTGQQLIPPVLSLAFDADRNSVGGYSDGTIKLTGYGLDFKGHKDPVSSIAVSTRGPGHPQRIASSSTDGDLKLWDAPTGQEVKTLISRGGGVNSLAFSHAGGRLLASGHDDATIRLWVTQTGQEALPLQGHTGPISCVTFSRDDRQLASGSKDGTIRLWDTQTGKSTRTIEWRVVDRLAFSEDGSLLVGAFSYGGICTWDARTGRRVHDVVGPPSEVLFISALAGAGIPPNRFVFTACADGTQRTLDIQTGIQTSKEGAAERPGFSGVSKICLDAEGERLATICGADTFDGTIKLWDAQAGPETHELRDAKRTVTATFSADGLRLAGASKDGVVHVWDTRTGTELTTLRGQRVSSLAFSPDGHRLAGALWDGVIKLWDLQTGQVALTLKVQGGSGALHFSPDGRRLVCTTATGIHVWDATPLLQEAGADESP